LFEEFIKGFPPEDYEYICLQKYLKSCDQQSFKENSFVKFFGDDLHDFSDTAALIDCVDLVVSSCTSVPHLSASLGKETWIILSFVPDWRWFLGREDTPWYPTVKLFRQNYRGDWSGVLNQVKEKLSTALV